MSADDDLLIPATPDHHPVPHLGAGQRHAHLVQDVHEIRRLHSVGLSARKVAALFGVGPSQVLRIIRRECWSHA